MDARFGSTSPYFRVFAYGKSESRLDGIGWDNFQKAKLLRVFFCTLRFFPRDRCSTLDTGDGLPIAGYGLRIAALIGSKQRRFVSCHFLQPKGLREPYFRYLRTSAILPSTAAAAHIWGLIKWVLPPGPWRPSKLRLLDDAQRSPFCN